MKMIDEIRRERLAQLAKEMGGVKVLAERIERDPSQVSQWINASRHSGTGKPRGIRDESCRYIEIRTGKPAGWMDRDPDEAADGSLGDAQALADMVTLYSKVPAELRARVYKAVRDVIVDVGGLDVSEGRDRAANDKP